MKKAIIPYPVTLKISNPKAADKETKYRIRLRNFFCCQCQGLAASSNYGVTCFRCRHDREHCDSCSKGQSHFLPVSEDPYNPKLCLGVRFGKVNKRKGYTLNCAEISGGLTYRCSQSYIHPKLLLRQIQATIPLLLEKRYYPLKSSIALRLSNVCS